MKEKYTLKYHFENPNYIYFFVSLILLLVIPAFAPLVVIGNLLLNISFFTVVLMAVIYTSRNIRDLVVMGILGTLTFILFSMHRGLHMVTIMNPIVTSLFFGMVFIRLIQFVFEDKSIELNDILALSSGYVIIGVVGAPFFYAIHLQIEGAFSLSEGTDFYNMLYFSFITLTGVGYGDIVPVHATAKSISIVLGVIGQLYLAIIVGIIIGKYLTK